MSHDEWVKRDADVVWHGFTQMSTYADNRPVIVERGEAETCEPLGALADTVSGAGAALGLEREVEQVFNQRGVDRGEGNDVRHQGARR